ncbi:MAG: ATP-binding cassette domain-containing protein [[Clostridium] scindens]
MSHKLIDIVNISKSFGDNLVLDDLNLYIRENEFLTLLGPSGCGKTTLLRILGGFETAGFRKMSSSMDRTLQSCRPTSGSSTPYSRNMPFSTHMTIAENIAFGLKIKGKSKAYIKR